jgi:hypothetical protein
VTAAYEGEAMTADDASLRWESPASGGLSGLKPSGYREHDLVAKAVFCPLGDKS